MADHDILEFLLLQVSRRSTKLLAQRLLSRFGSFARVIAAPVWDLLSVEGLSADGTAILKSVQAAALRLVRAEATNMPMFDSRSRLVAYLHAELSRERAEQFRVLFLDTRGRLIADETLHQGTVDHVNVHLREVAKRALELHAASLILVHNHPSGDPTPSEADFVLTETLGAAIGTLSINLVDHIIIGDGRWFSFRDNSLFDKSAASIEPATGSQIPFLGRCSENLDAAASCRTVRSGPNPRRPQCDK